MQSRRPPRRREFRRRLWPAEFQRRARGWRIPCCDVEHGDEENGADAVIEEGFAGKLGFNVLRNADASQHFQYCDGIGGGYERAEDQTLNPRDAAATHELHQKCDEEEHDARANRGQQCDCELFPDEFIEVEQKGACKQQKGQHATEDQRSKINLVEKRGHPQMNTRYFFRSEDECERGKHRQQHRADGDGQFEPAAGDQAEDGCGGEQKTQDLQDRHRAA